jgi:hypothetical protein
MFIGIFFPSFLIGSKSRVPYAPKMLQFDDGPVVPVWEKPEYVPSSAEGSNLQVKRKIFPKQERRLRPTIAGRMTT